MSYEPPTPPAELPTEIVNTLNEYPPEQLQHVARYAEELAEHKARETRLEKESDEEEIDEQPDDLPDDVPSKATITIKEINDNRYYYWQWRDGDRVNRSTKDQLVQTSEEVVHSTPDPHTPLSKCKSAKFRHLRPQFRR